ncbi:hypothetical protein [Sinanaerobacter sp. ZZT-01]|uniref:hypothetical protein n=1 Tax=Sinanaerobacter sp. ZZT-01 TaxID=3111540 RepID=UPI002D785A3D|nr:hypothetical protein [Sinanaerobacter sp. ZZT-01]WRR92087.1 hypothetical protein U5921_08365 [Sinanaerobacter sp. ZZT-01]
MKHRNVLNLMLELATMICLIFLILVSIFNLSWEFKKIGINIYFILFLILGMLFLYFTFSKQYKRKKTKKNMRWELIERFLVSMGSFIMALFSYSPPQYFNKIIAIIIIAYGVASMIVDWLIEHFVKR